jgi:Recombinase
MLVDAGPHPNPAKAADGKRLHALAPDPETSWIVQRIFAEYLEGRGLKAIAEGFTRDSVPSPAAYDPARNKHRCGIAWAYSMVRAILANPRYTGRQVWNKQPKSEVLIDVNDVALGHTTKQTRDRLRHVAGCLPGPAWLWLALRAGGPLFLLSSRPVGVCWRVADSDQGRWRSCAFFQVGCSSGRVRGAPSALSAVAVMISM